MRLRRGFGFRTAAAAAALLALAACAVPETPPEAPVAPAAAPDAEPPSLLLGELFRDVALAGIFPDGKLWSDARPLRPPAEILALYHRERPQGGAALRTFVEAHFELPGEGDGATPPGEARPLCEHIASLWPHLTRAGAQPPAHSSLLPLQHRFLVPGGRFREVYYWDSYFTLLGLTGPQASLRREMVDNFADLLRRYGRIPNGNRTYYLSRSQPPFFFRMVGLLAPGDPPAAYAEYLDALRQEHDFWMAGGEGLRPGEAHGRVVAMPDGSRLNRYHDDRDAPRDESYAADVAVAARSGRPPNLVYRDLRAAAESGWDFSSRWLADRRTLATIQTTAIVPPDLNAILYGLERAIAEGCGRAGDQDCAGRYAAFAEARRAAMNRYLWNARTGLYDDYHWPRGERLGNVSAAALYPLFFGAAPPDRAARTARTVEARLLRSGGIAATDIVTGEQWDAPNGWAPLQWIAVEGLRAYGEEALAREIAARWLRTVERGFAESGRLLEKYDVVEQRPGGGGEYPLQDGFGWTNGVTVALLRRFPDLASSLGEARIGAQACRLPLAA